LITSFGTVDNYSLWNSQQLLTADVVKEVISEQAGGGWTVTTDTLAAPQLEVIGYTVYIHNLPTFDLPDYHLYNLMFGGNYMINYWLNETTGEFTSGSYLPVWWRNGHIENYQVTAITGSYPYTCNYITLPTHGEAIITIPDSVVSAGSWSPPSPSAYLAIEPDVTRLIPKAGIASIDTNVRLRQLSNPPLMARAEIPTWGDFSSNFHLLNGRISLWGTPLNQPGRIDVAGYVGAAATVTSPADFTLSFRIDLTVNPADFDQFVYSCTILGRQLSGGNSVDITGYVEFTSTTLTVQPHWAPLGNVSSDSTSVTVDLYKRSSTSNYAWQIHATQDLQPKVLCAGVTLGQYVPSPTNEADPDPGGGAGEGGGGSGSGAA
jgi:hypothetical protein